MRYIDADVLCKHFKILYEHAQENGMYNHAKLYDRAFRVVVDAPTADVVPRAEVDLYKKLNDELEDELASTYDKLESTKAEVEQIFAEIDSFVYQLMNSAYYSIGDIAHDVAELKKKYIGGHNDESK